MVFHTNQEVSTTSQYIFLLDTLLTATCPSFLVPFKNIYTYTAPCCAHFISSRLHGRGRTIKCMAYFCAAIRTLLPNPPSPRNLFAQCPFNNSKACCSVEATLRRVTGSVRLSVRRDRRADVQLGEGICQQQSHGGETAAAGNRA